MMQTCVVTEGRGSLPKLPARMAFVPGLKVERPQAPAASPAAYLIRSAEELKTARGRLGIREAMPCFEFEREMLLLVRGGVRLVAVDVASERIVVRYLLDGAESSPFCYRIVPRSALPVVFQKDAQRAGELQ